MYNKLGLCLIELEKVFTIIKKIRDIAGEIQVQSTD